jgi:hypothetical protein
MVSLLWRYGQTSLFRQSLPRDYAMSRPHISIAVAQRGSRTALLQRRRRLVLDGREHDGRLPAIEWFVAR